MSQIP